MSHPVNEPLETVPRGRGVIAMSGGVDSSVAAALLRKEGHEVVAISMRLYETAPRSDRSCCSPDDMFDARSVASRLDIPFYVANYVDAFRQRVIDYFVEEYRRGRTPNPCVACNNHLKFDVLLGRTKALGGDWLATGHYARIEHDGERWKLLKARDLTKDQSYFLCGLPRELLGRIRFPLGDLTKVEVRALADEQGLPTAYKPESQEICFVAGMSYRDFVKEKLADEEVLPGNIELEDGTVVGEHEGIHGFTIGQRRGLGIAWPEPLFVKRVVPETATVVVGPKGELMATGLVAGTCNWLRWDKPPGPFDAEVKIRYRADPVPCHVEPREDGAVTVTFRDPQKAVAPGQYAVFYDGDEVVGGSVIEMALGTSS